MASHAPESAPPSLQPAGPNSGASAPAAFWPAMNGYVFEDVGCSRETTKPSWLSAPAGAGTAARPSATVASPRSAVRRFIRWEFDRAARSPCLPQPRLDDRGYAFAG